MYNDTIGEISKRKRALMYARELKDTIDEDNYNLEEIEDYLLQIDSPLEVQGTQEHPIIAYDTRDENGKGDIYKYEIGAFTGINVNKIIIDRWRDENTFHKREYKSFNDLEKEIRDLETKYYLNESEINGRRKPNLPDFSESEVEDESQYEG